MKLPNKTLERKLLNQGYQYVIGIDEVGMGCLAGPVVVCATLFTKDFFDKKHKNLRWLRDSKLLLPSQREKFANELIGNKELRFSIAYAKPATIDRINIYQAARKAMVLSLKKIGVDLKKTMVLVDGNTTIKGVLANQLAIVKGDRRIFSIAAASIIAKVTRDKMMTHYSKKYPNYGFEKHKGYGTKLHQTMLIKNGPCEIHRKSFA